MRSEAFIAERLPGCHADVPSAAMNGEYVTPARIRKAGCILLHSVPQRTPMLSSVRDKRTVPGNRVRPEYLEVHGVPGTSFTTLSISFCDGKKRRSSRP